MMLRMMNTVVFLFFLCIAQAHAQTFTSLEWILKQPEDKIDLIKAQLTIEQLIDPTVNPVETRKQLEAMILAIKATLPATPSVKETLLALRQYLYFPGSWNDNRPFSYDLDDPFGENLQHKLLSNYLTTRKGNCVSMPTLYLLVGQKLGLKLSLSTAPNHLFVRLTAADGKVFNVEATNEAGSISDESVINQTGITELAAKNGIYMQSLNKKETVAVMMGVLMEYYAQQLQLDKLMAISDLALKYYPKDITAIVYKGTAYALAVQQEYEQVYPMPSMIPAALIPRFEELNRNRDSWYDRADALGFVQPNEASEEQYKSRIQQEKAKQH